MMKSYEEQQMGLGKQRLEACTQYREKEMQMEEEHKTDEEDKTESNKQNGMKQKRSWERMK